MGTCRVCSGRGEIREDASEEQRTANWRSIKGLCYLGSGPRYLRTSALTARPTISKEKETNHDHPNQRRSERGSISVI